VYALRAICAYLQKSGVPHEFVANVYTSVDEVPDYWHYATMAPPPVEIQQHMSEVFPEWVRAFESNLPELEQGPTTVGTNQQLDPDALDVHRLMRELQVHGHQAVLELPLEGDVWGIPIAHTVKTSLRMAAMYDLYMELRNGSVKQETMRLGFLRKIDPAWILLGLAGATVASHAAAEVMRHRAQAKKKTKVKTGKARMSTRELSELIRNQEG
jgi:hypothetical protein